ncbi:MAG: hypothetical protein KME30_08820 [Iphinoe sp. HA4291-MV1]|jgi:hypothetical protein|nr:hypothetical protein [Iphinoe sp. HA4291-MV1]
MMKEELENFISDIINKLATATDEETIKEIVMTGWRKARKKVPHPNTFARQVRTPLRKAIENAFPCRSIEEPKPEGYYQTKAGKNKDSRWEHLALWFATTNEDRWSVTGDEARAKYWNNLPPLPEKPVETQVEQPPSAQAPQEEQTQPTTLKLQNMTLEQLELDTETQQVVTDALNHSGMSLFDFIKQACKVYAKTIEGKAKQFDDDLSAVPTEKLLNVSQVVDGKEVRSKYFTHPKRAEELTKRAIAAIARHNINAPEKSQRWMITQTALQALTGSRPATIKKLLEQYKPMIDDHNHKYELNPYDNRKGSDRKIENEVDLVALVPDGLD